MKVFVSIDSIIKNLPKLGSSLDYKNIKPQYDSIEKINKMYDDGDVIIYYTPKGLNPDIDWENFIYKKLIKWGCSFNDIICEFEKNSLDSMVDSKIKIIEKV